MSVATFEGIVENGVVRLPEGIRLPERAVVFVVVPDGAADDKAEVIELPSLARRVQLSTPNLVRPEQAKDFSMEMEEVMEPTDAGI